MTTTDHNKEVRRLIEIFCAAIRPTERLADPTGLEHLEAPAAAEI
jgi:hypothetical protein